MTDKPPQGEEAQPPEGYEPPQVDEVTSPVAASPDAAPTNQDASDRHAKADFAAVEPDDALSAARGLVPRASKYEPPNVEEVDSPVAASPGTQVQTGVDRAD